MARAHQHELFPRLGIKVAANHEMADVPSRRDMQLSDFVGATQSHLSGGLAYESFAAVGTTIWLVHVQFRILSH